MSRTAEIVVDLVNDAADSLAIQLEVALSTPEIPWTDELREQVRKALAQGLASTTSVIIMALKKGMS